MAWLLFVFESILSPWRPVNKGRSTGIKWFLSTQSQSAKLLTLSFLTIYPICEMHGLPLNFSVKAASSSFLYRVSCMYRAKTLTVLDGSGAAQLSTYCVTPHLRMSPPPTHFELVPTSCLHHSAFHFYLSTVVSLSAEESRLNISRTKKCIYVHIS